MDSTRHFQNNSDWIGELLSSRSFIYILKQLFSLRLQVTHVWHNQTLRRKEDHQDHDQLRNCFYKGQVAGDDKSVVSVSLCGGMVSIFTKILQHIQLYNRFEKDKNTNQYQKHLKYMNDFAMCRFYNIKLF